MGEITTEERHAQVCNEGEFDCPYVRRPILDFEYDSPGRLINAVASSDGGNSDSYGFNYNDVGQLANIFDFEGNEVRAYEYFDDRLVRVLQDERLFDVISDADGRIVRITNTGQDAFGALVLKDQIELQYDSASNLRSMFIVNLDEDNRQQNYLFNYSETDQAIPNMGLWMSHPINLFSEF